MLDAVRRTRYIPADMKETVTPLERLRAEHGLSQAALAEQAGVSRDIITTIESGRTRNFQRVKLVKIARVLEVEVEDLFERATA